MSMSGGKSSPRLIEEILAFAPGQCLFTMPPYTEMDAHPGVRDALVYVVGANGSKQAPATDYVFSPRGEDGNTVGSGESVDLAAAAARHATGASETAREEPVAQRIRGTFAETHCHLEAVASPPLANCNCDWHAAPLRLPDSLEAAGYLCSRCGSSLTVGVYRPELSQDDWSMFDEAEIHHRWTRFRDTFPSRPSRAACIALLHKITTNVLMGDSRPIRKDNARANSHIDIYFLSRRLGFEYSEEAETFTPPALTPQLKDRYARVISELALQGLSLDPQALPLQVKGMEEQVYDFFVCPGALAHGRAHLSANEYGVLGVCDYFSDEYIWDHYRSQVGHDPRHVPYYLDALSKISQIRDSEYLQMKVMELISLGTPTLAGVQDAYAKLGIPANSSYDGIADSVTASLFMGKIQQNFDDLDDLTKSLSVIADFRQSAGLQTLVNDMSLTTQSTYRALHLDYTAPDAMVADRVKYVSQESGLNAMKARIALRKIALERKSPALLSLYEQMFAEEMSPESAYAMLGVSRSMDDKSIIAVFDMTAAEETSAQLLNLRRALRVVGEDRISPMIYNYLETGESEEAAPSFDTPVGLWNIGNTCYLNSLLQFYFTVSPLRDNVKGFSEDSDLAQKNDHTMSKKKVGGRLVPFGEVKRSQDFVRQLGKLFEELTLPQEGYVIPSEELAYMALVPPQEDENAKNEDLKVESNHVEAGTETLDEQATDTVQVAADSPSERPESADQMQTPLSSGTNGENRLHIALQRQQDVTECIENVLFQLEAAVRATSAETDGEQNDFVKDLFYGTTRQTLQRADNGENKRTKAERFSSVLVDVADGPRDIYDALDDYFSYDVITLSEGDTLRTVAIEKLPPIFQIQIQRVQFDRASGQVFKSLNPLLFENTIYLDRYMETSDLAMLEKREQVRAWRAERTRLSKRLDYLREKQENGLTRIYNVAVCKNWLKGQLSKQNDATEADNAEHLLQALDNAYEGLAREEKEASARIQLLDEQIGSQFVNYRQHGYRIHSLFIHRGQASFGHYWIYIYDFENGIYRKYNDEIVQTVSEAEVFDVSEENTATPYYLVFIRDDFIKNMMSVVRQVVPDLPRTEQVEQIEQIEQIEETEQIESDTLATTSTSDAAVLIDAPDEETPKDADS